MQEFDRLLREMRAATSISAVQGILRLSQTSNLSALERRDLWNAVPASCKANMGEEDGLAATIAGLEAMSVENGSAMRWSRETPWRQNPWQLIQVSAGRACVLLVPHVPAPIRLPLLRMGRAVAIGDRPTLAWAEVEAIRAQFPGPAGGVALKMTSRLLLAAWTTMTRLPTGGEQILGLIVQNVARSLPSPVAPPILAASLEEVRALASAAPEVLANRIMTGRTPVLAHAVPELLASTAVLEHMRRPADAEAWLNRLLVDDLRPK
jgi:hypothetical protein